MLLDHKPYSFILKHSKRCIFFSFLFCLSVIFNFKQSSNGRYHCIPNKRHLQQSIGTFDKTSKD